MGFGNPQAGMHSWTLPYEESKKIIKHTFETLISVLPKLTYSIFPPRFDV